MMTSVQAIKRLFIIPLLVFAGAPLIVAFSFAGQPSPQLAGPWVKTQVVVDRGGQAITAYLSKNQGINQPRKSRINAIPSDVKHTTHASRFFARLFPVVTPSMRPGKVTPNEAKHLPYHLSIRPMFILGDDPVSLRWLQENRD